MNSSLPNETGEIRTISIQNTDQMWDLLAGKLDEFYQAWESKSPPDLEKFVPTYPVALRRFALNELIKADLELRLENGCRVKSLADYVKCFPELLRDGKVDEDLLFEDIELRKRHQQEVKLEAYVSLLPSQAETLRKLLGGPQTLRSAALPRPSVIHLTTGSRIDDFELLIELGKGAFATVFLARQLSMQRFVALKVSRDRGEEPQTLAQLDCKNIVRVFDVRDIDHPRCRLLYMKFVAGGSLQDVIQRIRDLPWEDRRGALVLSVIDEKAGKSGQDIPLGSRIRQRLLKMEWFEIVFWLASEIAEGLAYAHREKVLHRDLKPANVLMTTEGIPQIADFNVSFRASAEAASAEAFFGGSLAYMSPEQLEAFDPERDRQPDELTAASDIYSLGIIVWELMFGSRPFSDQITDSDYSKIIDQLIEQRQQLNVTEQMPPEAHHIDVDLPSLFASLLDPDPDRRPADAQSLAGDLALLSHRPSRELLRPRTTRLAQWLRDHVAIFVVLAVVVPSALAARFNFLYNWSSIIVTQGEDVQKTFIFVQRIINAIAFPLGIALLIGLSRRLRGQLRELQTSREGNSWQVRKHLMQMPLNAVLIPLAIWTVCGLAYPLAMKIGQAPITLADSIHFLTSLILCGLIASVYPFFLVSYVAIRYWYPAAFVTRQVTPEDAFRIEQLTRRVWFFMLLGVVLPTFSMLLMALTQRASDRFLLALLAGSTFIALGVVFLVFQKLQQHLETIRQAITRILDN